MGLLYDYFRAPGVAEVRSHMDADDAFSPVPEVFDGIDLKGIDPTVVLGRLVGLVTDRGWAPDLGQDRLVWPEGGEQDLEHEGPWVTVLDDRVRDVLAGVAAERVPDLAGRWAATEEFGRPGDAEFLRDVVSDLAALAMRARERGESLYCWMSL